MKAAAARKGQKSAGNHINTIGALLAVYAQ